MHIEMSKSVCFLFLLIFGGSPIPSRHERDSPASADGRWVLRDGIENWLFYQEIDGELEISISFSVGYFVLRMEERC